MDGSMDGRMNEWKKGYFDALRDYIIFLCILFQTSKCSDLKTLWRVVDPNVFRCKCVRKLMELLIEYVDASILS